MSADANSPSPADHPQEPTVDLPMEARALIPIPNYTLTTVCPACGTELFRHACKVRCPRCSFVWDCSEL